MDLSTKRTIFGFVIFVIICMIIYYCLKYHFKNYTHRNIIKNKYTKKHLTYENLEIKKDASKSKFLIIQDGAYEKYPEYIQYSEMINKLYCKKWGYEYKFIKHNINEMPPYWLKVYDMHQYLNKGGYDYIMYLDADAIFYDFKYSLEDVLSTIHEHSDKSFDVYIGKDPSFNHIVNSGVFLFKNTDFAKKLLDIWLLTCVDTEKNLTNQCLNWKLDQKGKKWMCEDCWWGGVSYEQGSFNQLYELYPENIALLDETFLSNMHVKRQSFILHMMGSKDNNRLEVFKKYYEKIKNE